MQTIKQLKRQADGQTFEQTGRQTNNLTDMQTDKQLKIQAEKKEVRKMRNILGMCVGTREVPESSQHSILQVIIIHEIDI